MTTDGGGWTIAVFDSEGGFGSKEEYLSFCASKGFGSAGRGVEKKEAWLATKRFLWNTSHPISVSWPAGTTAAGGIMTMPIWKIGPNGKLVTLHNENLSVELPPNLIGDYCDAGDWEHYIGYWDPNGWSDPDLSAFPDPEDWGPQYGAFYHSCIYR